MGKKIIIRKTKSHTIFIREIGAQEGRKLKAQRNAKNIIWFGLGMLGLIGWSVAVPTLIGAAIGLWLDKSHPGTHSWTLTLLIIGLVIGCLNAWHWIKKESKEIHKNGKNNGENNEENNAKNIGAK